MTDTIDLIARLRALGIMLRDLYPTSRYPDDVDAARAALEAAETALVNFPCDGGCNANDGPAEECSLHGRSPRDLWDVIGRVQAEREAAEQERDAARATLTEARNVWAGSWQLGLGFWEALPPELLAAHDAEIRTDTYRNSYRKEQTDE